MKLLPSFTHPCAILTPHMWNRKGEIVKNVLVVFLHTITKNGSWSFYAPKRIIKVIHMTCCALYSKSL